MNKWWKLPVQLLWVGGKKAGYFARMAHSQIRCWLSWDDIPSAFTNIQTEREGISCCGCLAPAWITALMRHKSHCLTNFSLGYLLLLVMTTILFAERKGKSKAQETTPGCIGCVLFVASHGVRTQPRYFHLKSINLSMLW